MNLVIVESPAKAKTIQKYLGKGFIVKSSYGHVRDLPKTRMGVDIHHDFEPTYVIPPKARQNIKVLREAAKKADSIYFATDEDREGEAIAWHLSQVLKTKPDVAFRITFDEITQSAITKALEHPRDIDQQLVDAQQARRVLDRLVGYELSPLLWRKIRRGLSAGRVQSVAVRLIVEREEEIKNFKPQEYWSLTAHLQKQDDVFQAQLFSRNNKRVPKRGISTKEEVEAIMKDLEQASYIVEATTKTERKRTPPPPFTTSTLQQAAGNQLGFSSKKTMMLAQQLYEGIDLGAKGPTGVITYMRTDSTNLAQEALRTAHKTITTLFGPRYAIGTPRVFAKKSKGAQEAHEAIRPTDVALAPDDIIPYLSADQFKLYRLIWQRMIASQMANAIVNQTIVDIQAANCIFRAMGVSIAFDGFLKVLGTKAIKEITLPDLKEKDELELSKLSPEQHFTLPPARYTEASLVKTLEENGIGRPSTYAPTIDVIQRRGYVEKGEDKRFQPTEIGTIVNTLLTQHFPNIVDVTFTAHVENNLDDIATGKKKWQPVVKEFYDPFHSAIQEKHEVLDKKEFTQEETGETCPLCSKPLVIKLGRFGKFKACSGFPECKYTEPLGKEKAMQEEHTGKVCPECGKELVLKRGRFGPFLGCSGYPSCKHIEKIEKDTGVTCPKCGKGKIVEKKSKRGKTFYACNRYPDCENAYWNKPTGEVCPTCGSLLVHGANHTVRCSNRECGFSKTSE